MFGGKIATKRNIYDNAKNGRSTSSSYSRSSYQPRDYSSSYATRNNNSSSRYSDYYSSKSNTNHPSMFRGLFEKTFSRFFGGR